MFVFRRLYEASVKSKRDKFYLDIKKEFKQILVPSFEKARKYNSQFHRMHEMNKHDFGGSLREKWKVRIKAIKKSYSYSKDLVEYRKSKEEGWNSTIISLFDEWFNEYFLTSSFADSFIGSISYEVILPE